MEILSTLASKTQDQFMVNVIHIQVFLLKASSWLLIAPSLDVGETRSPLVVSASVADPLWMACSTKHSLTATKPQMNVEISQRLKMRWEEIIQLILVPGWFLVLSAYHTNLQVS